MVIVTQSQVASAPARRQGFARFTRRLTPPLTAASAPAQRAISSCLTQLLRSFNHWLRHEIPDNSCFRFEIGIDDTAYIQYGYWDSLRKGFAGRRTAST